MSRYSETSDIIKKTTNQLIELYENEVSADKMTATQLYGIYNILTDIALSLAVIADMRGKKNEDDD